MAKLERSFVELVAREIGCRPQQVVAADGLFEEGATVPFVARYRKEVTGGLEDIALEKLLKRRQYFLDLAERRDTILKAIDEQGQLTEELAASIRSATGKQELEDLYLPYKRKRRTRAQMAREKGLEPLAEELLEGSRSASQSPRALARPFVDSEMGVADLDEALAGARDILAEQAAENPGHRAALRARLIEDGELVVKSRKQADGDRYRDYFDHREPLRKAPSHRLLAIHRGETEGALSVQIELDDETMVSRVARGWKVPLDTPCGREVFAAADDGYGRLLRPSITNEVRGEALERAESEAIRVFRANLEALLLQAPLGQIPVMGLDPGLRTGCKVAVVDGTGRVVGTDVVRPLEPSADEDGARQSLTKLIADHGVQAVAVGNGTGSRETEAFVRRLVRDRDLTNLLVVIVPETGASVYSASSVARDELPEMDVSLRGAVSIARRLQDPLAELVKIEPRSLGIGQYQHDVDQKALAGELDLAVEGVVNRVGVELNSASASLLRRVSGITEKTARKMVEHREKNGPFASRAKVLKVPGVGPRTFELAAGFLRIRGADNPLDATAVHPERYALVETMARKRGVPVGLLVGREDEVSRIDFGAFLDEARGIGRFTLEDIKQELLSPGRDPRPLFEAPAWRDDVTSVDDLQLGMTLEGRVSNVTNFGAFVDIGVKRDGLVHLSELSSRWVEDPREVVKVGQVVKVQVKEVDRDRGRIGLSMKALEANTGRPPSRSEPKAVKSPSRGGATVDDLIQRFRK